MIDEKKPSTDEDILSVKNTGCPYHYQQKLRAEYGTEERPAEIVWSTSLQAWMPLSYRMIKEVAADHKRFLNAEVFGKHSSRNIPPDVKLLIAMDGDEHAAKKREVQDVFKTEQVEEWEPTARYIIQQQLDQVISGTKEERKVEIMRSLAVPIPIEIICEVMGMYPEEKIKTIKEHTDSVVSFLGHVEGDRFTEREEEFDAKHRYSVPNLIYSEAVKKRITPDNKLFSTFVNGGKHTNMEIVSDTSLLLFTGNITTTALIGFCFYHLAQDHEIFREVENDRSLIDNVISEIVRLEAPAQATYRVAATDVEIGGKQIKKGDSVYLLWSSAGRDPQKYENPDIFDIHRKEKGNLSFGIGKHRCIGEKLSWMETRVTLEEALDRLDRIALPEGYQVQYTDMPLFRGLKELPLHYNLK